LGEKVNQIEWDKAFDGVVEQICNQTAEIDRVGWMEKTRKKSTTKLNLFSIVDLNGDRALSKDE